MSDFATPAKPDKRNHCRAKKPHYILLRCVDPAGSMTMGESYYARKAKRQGKFITEFEVIVDGVTRVFDDRHFQPCNPANWWMFSQYQRDRFNIPAATARFGPGYVLRRAA